LAVQGFTATGDLNNTPAGLDPNGLQNNGGPTRKIALLPTSPAVDKIPVEDCTQPSRARLLRPTSAALHVRKVGPATLALLSFLGKYVLN
jgi:hypothetical protein